MLLRRRADLGDDVRHATDGGDDLLEGFSGGVDERRAGAHLVRRIVDQAFDLFGGRGGALGEVPHLGGDDGESATLLARARRFDGRVQGEEVRLERDVVDDVDDVRDLPRRFVDLGHGADGRRHDLAALLGGVARRRGELVRLAGVVGVLPNGRRDLLETRRRLLEARSLLLGPARQLLAGTRELLRGAAGPLRGQRHLRDDAVQLLDERVEPPRHLSDLVGARRGKPAGQVAFTLR